MQVQSRRARERQKRPEGRRADGRTGSRQAGGTMRAAGSGGDRGERRRSPLVAAAGILLLCVAGRGRRGAGPPEPPDPVPLRRRVLPERLPLLRRAVPAGGSGRGAPGCQGPPPPHPPRGRSAPLSWGSFLGWASRSAIAALEGGGRTPRPRRAPPPPRLLPALCDPNICRSRGVCARRCLGRGNNSGAPTRPPPRPRHCSRGGGGLCQGAFPPLPSPPTLSFDLRVERGGLLISSQLSVQAAPLLRGGGSWGRRLCPRGWALHWGGAFVPSVASLGGGHLAVARDVPSTHPGSRLQRRRLDRFSGHFHHRCFYFLRFGGAAFWAGCTFSSLPGLGSEKGEAAP